MTQSFSKPPRRSILFWVITIFAAFFAISGLIAVLYLTVLQMQLVIELMSANESQKTLDMMWKVTRDVFFITFLPMAMFILMSNAALFALVRRNYGKARLLIFASVICAIGMRLSAGDLSVGPDLESNLVLIFKQAAYIFIICALFLYAKKYQARDASILAAG